ncbi:MAG: type II secretion system F family protein [Candidatus Melainabacteria bacterium]|nr:type II secretion system F family protein [Candidatus Melainabacteria bacterium]
MPTFTYKARNNKGELKESSILADTPDQAKASLKQEGLWVLDLKQIDAAESKEVDVGDFGSAMPFTTQRAESSDPRTEIEEPASATAIKKAKPFLEDFLTKYQPISLKDMVIFSRQFASMVEAGVAMLRALNVMTEQTQNPRLKKALSQVRYDIEQGSTLSDALDKHPKIFDRLYISMVKAGEAGGVLDQVLNRLAMFMEERSRLTQQVKAAMTYPVVVMFIAVGVFYAMLTLVLPTFSGLFNSLGSELPAYTRLLIRISEFLRSWYMLAVIGIIVGTVWALKNWYQTKEGKFTLDFTMLKLPVLGDILRKVAVARFTRTFGTLTKSGVPIITALEVVKDSAGNAVLARAVEAVQAKVQEGGTISGPMSESKLFPQMVTQMIAIGEETGQLENMLEKVADFYDIEVATAVEGLTSLMEPFMIVTLGGLVGAIVIGMYLPIFTVISQIK